MISKVGDTSYRVDKMRVTAYLDISQARGTDTRTSRFYSFLCLFHTGHLEHIEAGVAGTRACAV